MGGRHSFGWEAFVWVGGIHLGGWKKIVAEYEGIELTELEAFEKKYDLQINVYELRNGKARNIREGLPNYQVMTLAKYENHFMLIRKPELFAECYVCPRCSKLWDTTKQLYYHMKHCNGGCYEQYPKTERYWDPTNDRIELRRKLGRSIGWAVFDFETFQPKSEVECKKLQLKTKHFPVACGLGLTLLENHKHEVLIRETNEPEDVFIQRVFQKLKEYQRVYMRTALKNWGPQIAHCRRKMLVRISENGMRNDSLE